MFLLITITYCLILSSFAIDFKHKYEVELDAKYWYDLAKVELFVSYHRQDIKHKAKNVIIFVGGGMGVPTITGARILKGQLHKLKGEEEKMFYENFPNTCFLKTYSVDSQVTDAAAAATALLYGVKTNNGVTGVTAKVINGESNCEAVAENTIISIFDMAYMAGKSSGIITTTRLTQAIAAGAYASIADMHWEGNIPLKYSNHPSGENCKDKARQLIEEHPGKYFKVIFGGGGRFFYPHNYTDPTSGKHGHRMDGLNLVDKWKEMKKEKNIPSNEYKFVTNREEMRALNYDQNVKYALGIFHDNHMNYEQERDNSKEPSIAEMTETAIKVLQKNDKGYILLVESGQIDSAHHGNNANLALYEALALDKAVEKAYEMVSTEDTLIVVTSDYSQAITINGYAQRGNNIMGTAGNDDDKRRPFTTIIYSTGPGYRKERTDPSVENTTAIRYQSASGVYLDSSTHTGEDVALYAVGPMSHVFHSTKEQSYVSHAIQFAACIGLYSHYDHCLEPEEKAVVAPEYAGKAGAHISQVPSIFLTLVIYILLFT